MISLYTLVCFLPAINLKFNSSDLEKIVLATALLFGEAGLKCIDKNRYCIM